MRALFSREWYDSDRRRGLRAFSCWNSVRKYLFKGAVANIHWRIEFMKHVLPILLRPVALYPYPFDRSSDVAFLFTLMFSLSIAALLPIPSNWLLIDDDFRDDTSLVLVGSVDFSSSSLCRMEDLWSWWWLWPFLRRIVWSFACRSSSSSGFENVRALP